MASLETVLFILIPVIVLIHNIMLFIYHIYRTKSSSISSLSIVALFSILMYIVASILFFHLPYQYRSWMPCKWRFIITYWTYLIARYCVYILLIERLFIVFHLSYLEFSKIQILCARLLLALLLSLSFISVPISYIDCSVGLNPLVGVVGALFDFATCTIILILFSRRMRLLLCRSTKMDETYYETLLYTLKKITILGMITCITTPLSIILFLLTHPFEYIFIFADNVVNSWCIVLMFKIHEKLFNILCKPLSTHLSNQCLSYCSCQCCSEDTNKIEKSIEITE
eukprot:310241_1